MKLIMSMNISQHNLIEGFKLNFETALPEMRTTRKDVKNNSIGTYAAAKFHPNQHHQVVVTDNINDNIALNVFIEACEP